MKRRHKSKKWKQKKHQQYVMRKALKKVKRRMLHHIITSRPYGEKYRSQTPSFKIKQLLEYHVFFGEDVKDVSIEELISIIPREMLFNFVGVLNNKYGNATLDKLGLFFSPRSVNNRRLIFHKVAQLKKENPQREFIFCSDVTCMEIMRYAFAYSPVDLQLNLNEERGEMLFFKLLLAINEQIVAYKPIENNSISKMCFMLSSINSTIHSESVQDVRDRIALQIELAVYFFKFLLRSEKYRDLYNMFLSCHHIDCWEDYIITIYGILAAGHFKSGRIEKNLRIDVDNLITKEVLSSISLPYNTIVNYSAVDKNDRNSNTDYRVFRDKPVITLENGDFFIHNIEFMIDRLFNSLYFEFKSYNQHSESKIDITELFTDKFAERLFFDTYLKNCINRKCCQSISEEECRMKYTKRDNELGAPDYIIKEKDSLLLFECKDIRISGEIIEMHDYEQLIQEYKNKLFKKPDKRKDKTHRIGITQLTGHVEAIRKTNFNWCKVDKNIRIYPVIVLSDYKNLRMGFNVLANEWYQSSIEELGVKNENNKPLIVMSFITLFKYHNLFKKNGFKYYFDLYIKSIVHNKTDIVKQNQTFDFFMSSNPYHAENLEKEVLRILNNKVKRNELSINK